jgi:predicted ArsR family transcriptional regulator
VNAPIRACAAGPDAEGAPRALATLSRLAELLPPGDSVLAVDAETASRVLEVTPRTARRLLRALAEEGLAWPLPPNRAPQPGRPRQSYRLVVERLDRNRTGDDGQPAG